MLYVYFNTEDGIPEDYISKTKEYFDYMFEDSWLENKNVQNILKEIDDVDVLRQAVLFNKDYGYLNPTQLSTGCKTLILVEVLNLKVNGDRMGDNCYPILFNIAENKDVYIYLNHYPNLKENKEAFILNTNQLVKTANEFFDEYLRCMYENKIEVREI